MLHSGSAECATAAVMPTNHYIIVEVPYFVPVFSGPLLADYAPQCRPAARGACEATAAGVRKGLEILRLVRGTLAAGPSRRCRAVATDHDHGDAKQAEPDPAVRRLAGCSRAPEQSSSDTGPHTGPTTAAGWMTASRKAGGANAWRWKQADERRERIAREWEAKRRQRDDEQTAATRLQAWARGALARAAWRRARRPAEPEPPAVPPFPGPRKGHDKTDRKVKKKKRDKYPALTVEDEDSILAAAIADADAERAALVRTAVDEWAGYPKGCPEGHLFPAPRAAQPGETCIACGAMAAVVQSCQCDFVVCAECQRSAGGGRVRSADDDHG